MKGSSAHFRWRWAAPLCLAAALLLGGCALNGSALDDRTAQDWYEAGRQQMAKKRYQGAIESFQEAMKLYRDASLDAEIQLALGDAYFREKDYESAVAAYNEFLRLHPRNRRSDYAQFQIGMSNFKQMRGKDRTQEPSERAIEAFEKVVRNYPRSPLEGEARKKIVIARRRLAEHEIYVGRYYMRTDAFTAALPRFDRVYHNFSDLGYGDEALYYMGLCYLELEESDKARQTWDVLRKEYPQSRYLEEIGDLEG